MQRLNWILLGLLGLATVIGASACSDGSAADTAQARSRINVATTNIGSAFNSMLDYENGFAQREAPPKRADLDVFWMLVQSTTRNLERVNAALQQHPSLRKETMNQWNGRVQEPLTMLIENATLTSRGGAVSSRLGEAFGEERVAREFARLREATTAVQNELGIASSSP